jgi:hypothetical protein
VWAGGYDGYYAEPGYYGYSPGYAYAPSYGYGSRYAYAPNYGYSYGYAPGYAYAPSYGYGQSYTYSQGIRRAPAMAEPMRALAAALAWLPDIIMRVIVDARLTASEPSRLCVSVPSPGQPGWGIGLHFLLKSRNASPAMSKVPHPFGRAQPAQDRGAFTLHKIGVTTPCCLGSLALQGASS